MEGDYPSTLKGHFLMAMPGLMDPNFFQTVTCISEHTESGALGIVINRAHPTLTVGEIFKELHIQGAGHSDQEPVYIGGPVHMGEVFVLHGPPFGWSGCLRITPTLALSNTKDILESIAGGKGPEFFMVALGCAGWGQGQLEMEIRQNAWLTGPVKEDIIFNIPPENRWVTALKAIGVDPSLLSGTAGNA